MRVKSYLLLLSLVIATSATQVSRAGVFAGSAASIWGGNDGTIIASPDGRKAIEIGPAPSKDSDANHVVSVKSNGHTYQTNLGALVNAETVWSSDSKAFFVTYSDGGVVGACHTKVFFVTDNGLHVIEPIPNGRVLFPPNCFEREYPNVAGIKWMGDDSSRLLLAVQVPPHSSCASMGTFKAFEIALPDGKIVARYDQLAAKRMFGNYMGLELKNADDNCVRAPETCVPKGLKSR